MDQCSRQWWVDVVHIVVNGSTASGHDYWHIKVTLKSDVVWQHTS